MKEKPFSRRHFLKSLSLSTAALCLTPAFSRTPMRNKKPNVIFIFCDDLGYGDLGTFGHPTIKTPNLDRLANKGQKWTNFYAAASVCTPSRAGIMTGRYPIRSGMCSDKRRVLFPDSTGGLPQSEITIARALKNVGYNTTCIGKWHLGHLPQYLPTKHGFDYYFGIPYSNDMDAVRKLTREDHRHPQHENYNVPLMRNEEVIERPAYQHTITKRYSEEAVKFIEKNSAKPFFIYLAHNLPHIPLFTSEKFAGTSERGLYGDVVEEIDSGVGQIMATLKQQGLEENTLFVFTSDNGPWLVFNEHGGSAGLLREGKGMTWEGGMREPTIFYWKGKISPGVVSDIGSTLDLFSSICSITGAEVPSDRVMDSEDLSPALFENKPSPRKSFFYYRGTELYAARKDSFKAHFITQKAYVKDKKKYYHDPPKLYNLNHDPGEKYDISEKHPGIIKEIWDLVDSHVKNLKRGEDQLAKRIASNQ
jgi:arylsulfatase A